MGEIVSCLVLDSAPVANGENGASVKRARGLGVGADFLPAPAPRSSSPQLGLSTLPHLIYPFSIAFLYCSKNEEITSPDNEIGTRLYEQEDRKQFQQLQCLALQNETFVETLG